MQHNGDYMHVPKKYAFIWKKTLEDTLHRHINDEAWNSYMKWRNAKVGKGHLLVEDKEKPIFHDRCGAPACFNPKSFVSDKREAQREAQRVKEAIKVEEKRKKKIKEWEKRKDACIEEGRRLGILNSKVEAILQPIEAKSEDVAKDQRDLARDKDRKNGRYSQEIRNLACHFAAIGVALRKIPLCIKEVLKFQYPEGKFSIPAVSTVIQMVKEGGILSQLNALKSLHQMTTPLLGQDCSSSRGRHLLSLSALGSKREGNIILHTSEIVRKDSSSQADAIQLMLEDLKSLASLFPETSSFVSSIDITKFSGVMSDHTAVNKKIVEKLRPSGGDLLDIKCSAHKSNLIETAFLIELDSDRVAGECVENTPEHLRSLSMNAPKSTLSSSSAKNVLYLLTKSLSPTGEDKYSFASSFSSHRLLEDQKIRMIPIDGSRFHIYSQNSLELYQHLDFLISFLDTYLNQGSWTYSFLKKGLTDSQCLSEARLLAVFGYYFAIPMMYTFRKFSIGMMPKLWQTAEKVIVSLLHGDVEDRLTHGALWEHILSIESDDEKRKDIREHSLKLWKSLTSVFDHWSPSDSLKFRKCIKKSLMELRKIASEYLVNGSLADPPLSIRDLPADNLEIESYFAKTKETDTHSRHLSTQTLTSILPNGSSERIQMSENSMFTIRKIASETLTQREIDLHLSAAKKEKKIEEKKEKELKEARKRKRNEKIDAELATAQKESNPEKIRKMSNVELRTQLLLWKREGKMVYISTNKEHRVLQLTSFLNGNGSETA